MIGQLLLEEFLSEYEVNLDLSTFGQVLGTRNITRESLNEWLEALKEERTLKLKQKRAMENEEKGRKPCFNLNYFRSLR